MRFFDQSTLLQSAQLFRHAVGGTVADDDNLIRRAALLVQRLNTPNNRVFLVVPRDQNADAVVVDNDGAPCARASAEDGDRDEAQQVAGELEDGDEPEQAQQALAAL